MERSAKLLGDTPDRSYAAKLELFTRFAEPELRRIFSDLHLPAQGIALDVGCGTGFATSLLANELGSGFAVVGLDLSLPHLRAAQRLHDLPLVQCDIERLAIHGASVDFIWSCNTINHVTDKHSALRAMQQLLRTGGYLALAQSGFLPEMFFAWDAHLDDAVRLACHRYYRERYRLEPSDTENVRANVSLMQAAGFEDLKVTTHVIERIQPLTQRDRDYFQRAVFEGLWGENIRPFLDSENLGKLERFCDPASKDYWLDRRDFHHLQTVTVCMGTAPT